MPESVSKDIQLNDDPGYTRRSLRIKIACWGVLCLFLLLTAFGLTGDGPLSEVAHKGSFYEIRNARFSRCDAEESLQIILNDVPSHPDDTLTVAIAASLISEFEITSLAPQPLVQRLHNKNVEFLFLMKNISENKIVFTIKGDTPGLVKGDVRIEEEVPVEIKQFLLP